MIRIRALLLLALTLLSAGAASAEERPVSVQMHVHGSLSEGKGTMWGHTNRGEEHGLDVMWWSDHDNRIQYWQMDGSSSFGWEAGMTGVAPDSGATLEWVPQDGELLDPFAESTASTARSGSRSFRLGGRAPAGGDWRVLSFRYETGGKGFHRRSLLSDIWVRISVRPPADLYTNKKVALGFKLELSRNLDKDPMTIYWVAGITPPRSTQWEAWRELPALTPGEWNDLELPVSDTAIEAFPFGDDNSFRRFHIAVAARQGGAIEAFFDDFEIEVRGVRGEALLATQRNVIQTRYSDHMQQLAGFEMTPAGHHVNAFGSNVPLIDYDHYDFSRHPYPSIEHVHSHGGVVSYNHIFGAGQSSGLSDEQRRALIEKKKQLLLQNLGYGVDILEVGYTHRRLPIEDHLEVWDALSSANIFVTGNGVSDDHDADPWQEQVNRMVTWLWVDGATEANMLQALRAGRVFFGDPVLVDPDAAEMDITTTEGHRMGQVIITQEPRQRVRAAIRGIQSGYRIRAVVNGQVVKTFTSDGTVFEGSAWLPTTQDTFLRLEVWTDKGEPALFSNPIWFVKAMPEGGIPAARAQNEVLGSAQRDAARLQPQDDGGDFLK